MSSAACEVGDEVTLDVNVRNNPGVSHMELAFSYDASRLTYSGYEDVLFSGWTVTVEKSPKNVSGLLRAVWSAPSDHTENGVILRLRFAVPQDAPTGSAYVTIRGEQSLITDQTMKEIFPRIIGGVVSVRDHHQAPSSRDFFWLGGPELPKTGFPTGKQQILPERPLSLNYVPLGWTLEIPSVSVSAEIVTVPFDGGSYPVTWLGHAAGIPEGYSLPGEGRTILTGHNHLNTTASGPFALLKELKEGDKIFTLNPQNELTRYSVYANIKAGAYDTAALEAVSNREVGSIVLITCEDEQVSGGYASRRIVAAKPD